jgi:hypothetical protein
MVMLGCVDRFFFALMMAACGGVFVVGLVLLVWSWVWFLMFEIVLRFDLWCCDILFLDY